MAWKKPELKRLQEMTHGSLFSGIGGFDLAAEWMGWENVFHCERNPFGQQILKYYWPNAISYEDITKTDFTIWRGRIDILTGGFPCQPYSSAGQRKGKEDERHLWPEMLRAIREIKPTWVVGENVRGLVNWDGGLVFEEVQSDLEAEGYEVQPFLLPAAGVDAPHERYRIWFVAYSNSFGLHNTNEPKKFEGRTKTRTTGEDDDIETFADPDYKKRFGGSRASQRKREKTEQRGHRVFSSATRFSKVKPFADTSYIGFKFPRKTWKRRTGFKDDNRGYDASSPGRAELQGGKQYGGLSKERTSEAESGQFSRSIRSAWENFPTQPPVCNGNDGFPSESLRQRIREDCMGYLSEKEIDKIISEAHTKWREEAIKAGGNAIVPQVAHQIFKSIQKLIQQQ